MQAHSGLHWYIMYPKWSYFTWRGSVVFYQVLITCIIISGHVGVYYRVSFNYHIEDKIPNIQDEISHDDDGQHACNFAGLGGSVRCASNWWSGGCRFDPCWVSNIRSWRFDHEIFSTVILSLPLIKKGSCQFLAKEYVQYLLTTLRTKSAQ